MKTRWKLLKMPKTIRMVSLANMNMKLLFKISLVTNHLLNNKNNHQSLSILQLRFSNFKKAPPRTKRNPESSQDPFNSNKNQTLTKELWNLKEKNRYNKKRLRSRQHAKNLSRFHNYKSSRLSRQPMKDSKTSNRFHLTKQALTSMIQRKARATVHLKIKLRNQMSQNGWGKWGRNPNRH